MFAEWIARGRAARRGWLFTAIQRHLNLVELALSLHDERSAALERAILLHDPAGQDAWEGTFRDYFELVPTDPFYRILFYDGGSFDFVASFLMLHHVVEWQSAVAEVARVLRPGGTFFGYDLTATRLAEVVHWADRSPHLLVAIEELAPALRGCGLEVVRVRPVFARHVVQFRARRP